MTTTENDHSPTVAPERGQIARRGFLGALAASAAMALPAAAAASAAVPVTADPVFELIRQATRAEKRLHALAAELDRGEGEARDRIGAKPQTLIVWRQWHGIGGYEIERARDELIDAGHSRKVIEREYRAAKARAAAAKEAEADWFVRAGLADLKRQNDEAFRQRLDAERRIGETRPTTAAGAAIVVAFVLRHIRECEPEEWALAALRSVVDALRAPAGGAAIVV